MSNESSVETNLIAPHGGELVDLVVSPKRLTELDAEAKGARSWILTPKQLCDIEQLITGAFSPLIGFMNRGDYEGVCDNMRLSDGALWPMPIVLDLPSEHAAQLSAGERLALVHPEGVLIAIITVDDVWQPDRHAEAEKVFGTTDPFHPGVDVVLNQTNDYYVGGALEAARSSQHHTYESLRHTPAQLRAEFQSRGWSRIVAFQTRNPMHRAHVELTRRAAAQVSANLLIHPVVGLTKPGDVEYHTRVRCYQAIIEGYERNSATLSLLQLAMRMGGPREAVWHAIVRKNYGCTHFIVGRDHAGPGNDANGTPFYGPYDAQYLVEEHRDELGIDVVTFQEVVYDGKSESYLTRDELPEDSEIVNLSGTELRNRLATGADIPEWFSFPSVISELRRSYPAMEKRGFNVLVNSEDASIDSSIANALAEMLLEDGRRPVTVLDDGTLSDDALGLIGREVARNGGAVILICSGDGSERIRSVAAVGGVVIAVQRDASGVDVVIESDESPGEVADKVMRHATALGLIPR